MIDQAAARTRLSPGASWSRRDAVRAAVGSYDFRRAPRATRELSAGPVSRAEPLPEAVVVANDRIAIAGMDVLRTVPGPKAPKDTSVVGFDDVPQAAWGGVPPDNCGAGRHRHGRRDRRLLDVQMNRDPLPRHVVVSCRLTLRDSVGQPASRQARPN